MRKLAILCAMALTACNPMDLVGNASENAARGVVLPVLAQDLPAPVAEKGTDCIMAATSRAEQLILARDLGVSPGPQTISNIRNIAARADVLACFAAQSVPPLKPVSPPEGV
jgi:hypothetical protein